MLAGAQDTLYEYGPGGPFAAVNIAVKVVAGTEANWINAAQENADIVFSGAEYTLTEFSIKHKGLIDGSIRTELYKRTAAILVRPGKP